MATGDPTVHSSYGTYINLQDLSSSAQAIGAGSGELGVIFLSASVLHLGQTGSAAGVTVAARNLSLPDHDGSAIGLKLGGTLVTATAAELNKLDNCTATTAELNYVDVTAGTAAASKAVVLDASKNIATIGTIGCGAITSTGNSSFAQVTTSGRVIVDDSTEATSTTDGSLQTDGGLSVAKSAVVGDDLDLLSDSCVVNFGADKDITLTHTADTGLTMAGAHANGTNLKLNNTAADGDCRVELQLDGTTVWSMGVEDGDSDKFVIEDGAGALGADPAFEIAADKSAKFFGTLEATTSFTIGNAALTEAELEMLDGITAGTVAASKAVVVDANKDAASFRNLTATGAVTAGSFVIGSADISEAELETIDGVTAGTVAASKAVVVDSNKDIASFRHLTAAGAITAGTSFIIGSADLNEADMEKLDGITDGTGAANKALVLDASRNVGNINMLTASYARIGELDVDLINTINKTETTLEILDKLIVVASGSNAANSDAAGLQFGSIQGTDNVASILYDNGNSAIDFNIGGTTEVRLADGVFRPETDNDVDLGASGAEFKDGYFDGTVYVDSLQADQLGAALDANSQAITNINVDSGAIDNAVIGANTAAAGTFTALVGTSLSVSDGSITNVNDIALDTISADNGTSFSMGSNWTNASRTVADLGTVTTVDINGGTMDGVVIGAASAAAGTFAALNASTGTFSGVLKSDDTTEATSTTDGSLQTDGGLSVAKSAVIGDDLDLLSDSAILNFGADKDVTLTHVHNTGLLMNSDNQLQFGDSATYIQQSSDGILKMAADSSMLLDAPDVLISSSTSDKPQLELRCTNADANPGTLLFAHNSASPAADDELGEIVFNGDDDGGSSTMFAKMVVSSTDVSNGSEDGEVAFKIRCAGAIKEISMGGGAGLTLPNDSTYGVVKAHSLVTYSDETLKTNIQPLDSALDKVTKLQGVSYDWKSDGSADVGFIAQDVQNVVPQIVYGNQDGEFALDYSKLTSILVEAVKEQQAQINDLKAKLDK
tara:strand:+ start:549 stop:3581 length:3033 start_codon:yes stop_codon:yes gene_type:complete